VYLYIGYFISYHVLHPIPEDEIHTRRIMDNKKTLTSLVNKTVSGDGEAFEKLMNSHMGKIAYQIRSMPYCREYVEDISQKVAMKVFQHIRTLNHPEAFSSWLRTIVTRECLMHLKAEGPVISIEDLPGFGESLYETDKDYLPDAYVERREQEKKISEALKKLPGKSREMIVLYYNDGMCYKDIADQMGVTVGDVSVNLFRAKKRLRKMLPS